MSTLTKKIPVYVVTANGKTVPFIRKSHADSAVETLQSFGIEAVLTTEKREVQLSL